MADAEGLQKRCFEWLRSLSAHPDGGGAGVTPKMVAEFVQSEVALAEAAAYQRAADVVDTTEGDSVDEMVREQILALATPSSLGALEAYVAERVAAAYKKAAQVAYDAECHIDAQEAILALATPSSLGALEAYVAERAQEDRALIEQIRTIISDTETQYGEFNISAEFAIEQIRAALSAKEQGK